MSDEKLMDGIRLTTDAHDAGQLSALRDIGAMLEELTKAVRDRIDAIESQRSGLMPDLRGLSAREAIRTLSQIGMTSRMSGDGFVVTQAPAPGEALVPGGVCSLRLSRRPPVADTGGAPQ